MKRISCTHMMYKCHMKSSISECVNVLTYIASPEFRLMKKDKYMHCAFMFISMRI